jgi:hypothetical protein
VETGADVAAVAVVASGIAVAAGAVVTGPPPQPGTAQGQLHTSKNGAIYQSSVSPFSNKHLSNLSINTDLHSENRWSHYYFFKMFSRKFTRNYIPQKYESST